MIASRLLRHVQRPMGEGIGHQAWYLGVVPNVHITAVDGPSVSASPPDGRRIRAPHRPPSDVRLRHNEPSENIENSILEPSENDDLTAIRASEVQLIDRIEAAQLEGKLPIVHDETAEGAGPCPFVSLQLTKHGLKIVDIKSKEVLDRLPLHSLVQVVSFDDGLGNYNVAFKVSQSRGANNVFICYVFQARSENEADDICKRLRDVFQSVIR
uniref:PID domain-containing protein n=1 Tax=Plectus sambesii TaxID=2011161 RepID=A0A914VXS4_9BILA